jgi:acetoacetyl-CoA synthetase
VTETVDSPARTAPGKRPTQLAGFRDRLTELTDRDLSDPVALHDFSVDRLRDFWRAFLEWSNLSWEGSAEVVCTDDDVERAVFFPGVRLNYAENLLRRLAHTDDSAPALTSVHGDGTRERLTRAELRATVRRTATALSVRGVVTGDRVVVIGPNNARVVVAALAIAALGGSISSGMPDMGPAALLGRFEQVEPVTLLLDRTGTTGWDGRPGNALHALLEGLPTVREVLLLDDLPLPVAGVPCVRLADLVERVDPEDPPAEWPRLPFNHPLFVMFSSGTTGPPKALVHGAGGTLLEHVKEHRLHGDLDGHDTLYFHTTTAWMMWNWQLSALAVGASVVLYDGPLRGPETLWQVVADEQVTVFGTSPGHLQLCQDSDYRPRDVLPLPRLRTVLSTGSVLHDWQFDWFASAVGAQPLQSISGGTDLIGCFVLGHPEMPVRRGRAQSLSLALDVAAYDQTGRPVQGEIGELVCRRPFPSRPLQFLRDPDGRRMHEAYFAENPGVWTHGDLVDLDADGTARVHGRSDGVLNIDGIRIGPSEIYRILHGIPEIDTAMAVEQRHPTEPGSSRLVLLVVLNPGVVLDAELQGRIRSTLRRQGSAAHVPSVVLAVPEVPLTHSGKPSERAARDTLNGDRVVNVAALRNPSSLTALAAAVAELSNTTAQPRVAADDASPYDDATTRAVTLIWQDLLGAGSQDQPINFFDLGGTSRQSMTLLRRIRLDLGRDVSMESFLSDPTLSGLIASVRRAGAGRPSIVLLAEGDPQGGPLFLIHDAWGDVDVYRPLAGLLRGAGPVYGVRADLAGPDGKAKSISELAAADLAAVLEATPREPLRLAGFSFGGLVSFEMARLASAGGHEVQFVGLLDAFPPLGSLSPLQRRARWAAGLLESVVPGLSDRTLRQVLRDRLRPEQRPTDRRLLERSGEVYDQHRWGRYDGSVTYFRARRRIPLIGRLLGSWRHVAPHLTVLSVPGNHHDVLAQQHVDALAERMTAALRDASGRGARVAV